MNTQTLLKDYHLAHNKMREKKVQLEFQLQSYWKDYLYNKIQPFHYTIDEHYDFIIIYIKNDDLLNKYLEKEEDFKETFNLKLIECTKNTKSYIPHTTVRTRNEYTFTYTFKENNIFKEIQKPKYKL